MLLGSWSLARDVKTGVHNRPAPGQGLWQQRSWVWCSTGLAMLALSVTHQPAGGPPLDAGDRPSLLAQRWLGIAACHLLVLFTGWGILEAGFYGRVRYGFRRPQQLPWSQFCAWSAGLWGLVLVPVFVVVLFTAADLGPPRSQLWLGPLVLAVALAIALALVPKWLAWTSGTGRRVPDDVTDRLAYWSSVAQLPPPQLSYLPAAPTAREVALGGMLARHTMFVTEGLLAPTLAQQRDAWMCHELAHVRLWHPLRRAVCLVGLVAVVGRLLPDVSHMPGRAALGPGFAFLGLAGALAMLGAALFAIYARELEIEADLEACRLLRQGGSSAAGQAPALDQVAAAYTEAFAGLPGWDAGDWVHPGGRRRAQTLRQYAQVPAIAARRRRWLHCGEAIAAAIAVGLFL